MPFEKDNAKISSSTLVILIITVSVQIASLLIGLFMFVSRSSMIAETDGVFKYFVRYGVLFNLILVCMFIDLAFYNKFLHRLLNGQIRVLAKQLKSRMP